MKSFIVFKHFIQSESAFSYPQNIDLDNPAIGEVTPLCPEGSFSSQPVSTDPVLDLDIQALVAAGQASVQADHEYTFEMRVSKSSHPPSVPVERMVRVLKPAAPSVNIR